MAGNQRIEEVAQSGQAGRDLVQLEPLVFAPGEELAHGPGVGGPVWGLEIRARKNSSAAKQAARPARTRTAGRLPGGLSGAPFRTGRTGFSGRVSERS